MEEQRVAAAVREQIGLYEQGSLGFTVFEPIDADHPLHQTVKRLEALYASGQLPSPGRGLWRRLRRSANAPTQDDYLRVFDDLEAFEEWLVSAYTLEPPPDTPLGQPPVSPRATTPEPDLTEKQLNVYEAIDDQPRQGPEIAERSGESYEYVRKTLAAFIRMGLVTRVKRGYTRVLSA